MKPRQTRFAVSILALWSGLALAQASPTYSDDEAAFQAWRAQCQGQRRTDCDDYEVFKAETYPPGHRCLKQSGRCRLPAAGTTTPTAGPTATPQYESGRGSPSSSPAPSTIPQGEAGRFAPSTASPPANAAGGETGVRKPAGR